MRRVVLYFGSFNPVHRGHVAVAERVLERGLCDEVWFVVSPQNPLKPRAELIDEQHRLRMTLLAASTSHYPDRMKVCDVEFGMSRPSYTIDTLGELERRWPDVRFAMLVGTDIVGQIERWKQWEEIVSRYKIYVYPRRGYAGNGDARFEALAGEPFEDFSSTEVRRALASGDTDMVPEAVRNYIKEHKLWITQKKSPD